MTEASSTVQSIGNGYLLDIHDSACHCKLCGSQLFRHYKHGFLHKSSKLLLSSRKMHLSETAHFIVIFLSERRYNVVR